MREEAKYGAAERSHRPATGLTAVEVAERVAAGRTNAVVLRTSRTVGEGPADGVVIDSAGLEVDESLLTGGADSVVKGLLTRCVPAR